MGEVWDSSVLSRAEGLVKVGKYTEGRRRLPRSRGGVSFDVRFCFISSLLSFVFVLLAMATPLPLDICYC